jgi:hypothetical protein
MTLSPNTTHPVWPPGGTVLQYDTEGGGAAGVTQGNGPCTVAGGLDPGLGNVEQRAKVFGRAQKISDKP